MLPIFLGVFAAFKNSRDLHRDKDADKKLKRAPNAIFVTFQPAESLSLKSALVREFAMTMSGNEQRATNSAC